ncbi:fibronectin type III domain-containing protein 10-like isoform X2 [Oncorhynchus mykiss]|uniref:fibronectin type III domain-containing protein 10-like isoform X2 n=1 Tax=Oncorhynchus mykiss TaxID=8022 RepID=UPI000B4F1A2A|nr:fibronectin type III domain-containing protein 10-like isoform X2 [Oncorhynchus mykiss]
MRRKSLVAFSAVLFCLCRATIVSNRTSGGRDAQTSSTSSDKGSEKDVAVSPISGQQHIYNVDYFSKNETMGSPRRQGDFSHRNGTSSIKTSRGNTGTTMIFGRPDHVQGGTGWAMDGGVAPICAYRVMEEGIGGRLCFRHTLLGFRCHRGDCRTVPSAGGSLVANILTNGSVLLQWTYEDLRGEAQRTNKGNTAGHDLDKQETETRGTSVEGQKGAPGTGLGEESRDFLLTELHENVPYRICLHQLASTLTPQLHSEGAGQRENLWDCVEFTVSPLGMQDIVIAMTTVGGAICVMLVIICLLVAYITENIMSPMTQHSHSTYNSYH